MRAVEMVLDGGYDILITDIQMPGMTGYEFIEAVRAVDEDIPIIILTSDVKSDKIEIFHNVCALSKSGEPKFVYGQIRRLIYLLVTDEEKCAELQRVKKYRPGTEEEGGILINGRYHPI